MLTTPNKSRTVSSILEKLRSKNSDHEFQMTHQGLASGKGKFYGPEELKIVKTFNFDERTNPSHSSILYVIETNDGVTGYSLDAFGAFKNYKNETHEEFFSKIPKEEKDEKLIF
jgi:hypothetical protein